MKKTDLAWLAGVIDCEGHIGFETRKQIGANMNIRVTISNTDNLLIENALKIYHELGIIYYCRKRKRRNNDGHIRKECYDLQVHRIREVYLLLNSVLPYLVNKKVRAELALDYCKIRISKLDNSTANRFAKYGEEEMSLIARVRELNVRGPV